ncbi:tdrd9, partial [Symbiodinium necroappetens]
MSSDSPCRLSLAWLTYATSTGDEWPNWDHKNRTTVTAMKLCPQIHVAVADSRLSGCLMQQHHNGQAVQGVGHWLSVEIGRQYGHRFFHMDLHGVLEAKLSHFVLACRVFPGVAIRLVPRSFYMQQMAQYDPPEIEQEPGCQTSGSIGEVVPERAELGKWVGWASSGQRDPTKDQTPLQKCRNRRNRNCCRI